MSPLAPESRHTPGSAPAWRGSNLGGWFNGYFDYSGKIDGADYALIDAAFNSQGSLLRLIRFSPGTRPILAPR